MYLQIAVGAALVVGVLALAWAPISDYRYKQSPAGIEAARLASAGDVARAALRARVEKLQSDRCGSVGLDAIGANETRRITVAAEMAPDLLSDLRLCVERGIMSPYIRDRLSEADILKFTVEP